MVLIRFRALLLALAFVSAPHALAAEGAKGTGRATSDPVQAQTAAPTVYDVVVELGRTEAMRREIASALRDTADWKALADKLDDPVLAADLAVLEQGRDTLSRARYMELVDADTRIRDRIRVVSEVSATLGNMTQKLEAELLRLDREAALWPERAKLAREHEAPPLIQSRAGAVSAELAAMRDRLLARRDELLVAYERSVSLQTRLDAVRIAIAERRQRISAELSTLEDVPIWQQGVAVVFPRDELTADFRLARVDLADYLRQYGDRLGALLVVLSAFMFVVVRRSLASGAAALHPPFLAMASALLASLVLLAVLAPRGPFIFYRVITFAAPLLAGVVATRTFASAIPATAWTLILAVMVNGFRIVAAMSPGSAWLMLALQLVPFAIALIRDWRRGALQIFLPRWPPFLLRRAVQAVLLAIAVAIVANVLGYAGVARVLAAVFVVALGFALVFAALAWSLDQGCAGLLATTLAQSLRSVRERGAAILRVLHTLIVLFCWATGVLAFLLAHSALDDLFRMADFIKSASLSAGDVTITLSAILSALLVAIVTWLVTMLVRFVLDSEILPRLDLRTGVPIAISTIVGYVVVVTGFILTLAALGIDLTKVTLLAGALGVGVGLGLQGVVNNFASGLMLMFERPINVGDLIDVGGVLGEVKRIGVRSSTIRTFQGAEVIVPNSDLASKQVTNWTLSDRARRYEIDVKVAYGSDPARILLLLEGAAAGVSEVQKVPAPRALFTGFGDSSLDFRLLAWVESVDLGLQAQNNLRMAILRALDEAGIEIPYPQHDLHIRRAPATGAEHGLEASSKK